MPLKLNWANSIGWRRDCRIVQYRGGDIEDRSLWPEQHEWLLNRVEAFRRTFTDRVRALDLGEDDNDSDDIDDRD